MPIAGLTDRGLAFPQIGVIRKGAPKSERAPGKDLTYFRVEFDQSRPDLVDKFTQAYGQQPRRLNVVFPFNDYDRQAQVYYEAYNKGRMVARAGTISGLDQNQNYYLLKLEPKTGEVLAQAGYWVGGDKHEQPAVFDHSVPEYVTTYRDKSGQTKKMPVYCKPITRIKLVIPELGELAYLLLKSSSIYDAINLSEQLTALWEITHGRWAGMPLVLERKPTQILCPDENGNKTYREKWLLSIQALPAWSQAKLLAMRNDSLLLAAGSPLQSAAPAHSAALQSIVPGANGATQPAGEPVIDADDEDDDEHIPDEPLAWTPPAPGEVVEGEFADTASTAEERTWNCAEVSQETAMQVKGAGGSTYWSMESQELTKGLAALEARIGKNSLSPAALEDLQFRTAVIRAILEYRA